MAYNSTRELVLARRRAMSSAGKASLQSGAAPAAASNRPVAAAGAGATAGAAAPGAGSRPAHSERTVSVARLASIARRKAMSTGGRKSIRTSDRTRTAESSAGGVPRLSLPAPVPAAPATAATEAGKKQGCGCGCDGTRPACRTQAGAPAINGKASVQQARRAIHRSVARAASLARREATSKRGKSGIGRNGISAAQAARAGRPGLSSRDLAKALREQRSLNGKSGSAKSQPCGRVRTKNEAATGAAQDAPWKVGASETTRGQTVTGTMVGRSRSMTGDEASTCRAVTGTEYLGADIFRDFCQSEPRTSPRKITVTTTSHGNSVSGNRLGRASNVTGNEPGTCKRVTGNEYTSAEQSQGYCGEFMKKSPRKVGVSETRKGKPLTGSNVGRSPKVTGDETGMKRELTGTQYTTVADIGSVPPKVGTSATLRGGSVTGTLVGRSGKTTGDEAGSCRNVTGDEYLGYEQYSGFCKSVPQPADHKVGVSATLQGKTVTGTMTDRGGRVTGNEPGTCRAITGTPYAGSGQYDNFCKAGEIAMATARSRPSRGTPGAVMTGQQPGIDGKLTGAAKGACEPVSGTPYVGADQYALACAATAADAGSPDFPQPVGDTPWQQFSVSSPAEEARQSSAASSVTGSRYEHGRITGPFGMAPGKVTGTEEARFGSKMLTGGEPAGTAIPDTALVIDGRVKSRITGEGMNAGSKITGDDWDRGDRVTGTEGVSASGRNPTMRIAHGPVMAAAMAPQKRNEDLAVPSSKITGGSGSTDRGALVTYSGGARG